MSNQFFEDMMKSLQQAQDFIEGKPGKTRSREIIVRELPKYNSQTIKELRTQLQLTQKLFAGLMGVSVRTVESWENGQNTPNGSAARLMEFLKNHPQLKEEVISGDDEMCV